MENTFWMLMFDSMNGIADTAPTSCDGWQRPQSLQRGIEKGAQLSRRRVVVPGEHLRDEHAVPLKTWIDVHQADERPNQQPRARHQNQRQRHLQHHQSGTQAML